MTPADLTALDAIPKGRRGESYRQWKKRLTPEQWDWFLAVSRYLLDHSTQYYTFQCYICCRLDDGSRAREGCLAASESA